MGQFKPMTKMMTTEPTVELKLKKGGAVAMKKGGSTTKAVKMQMGGVPPMMGAMRRVAAADEGMAPAKPSMANRRSAMGRMADMKAAKGRGAMARMAAMGKKEGGETSSEHAAEMKKMAGTAKELKKHESMPASKAHKGLATGGVVMGQGGFKDGGIIKSTSGETKMVTATPNRSPAKTGDVKLGNGGGYKKGGSAKYAKGGGVEGNVSTAHAGVTNTKTGEVRKGNAGGYKKGGASKKFARGGSVQDDGGPMKMPQGQKRPPTSVSISRLSGTYKKGGDVEPDHASAKESAGYKKFYEDEAAENRATRESVMNAIKHPIETMTKLPGKIREGIDALRGKPGSVTKTQESVTVTPSKKRGGRAC